ncbi:MAG TPA: cupin domain-containing protein [Gaiellales bacterium]
MSGWRASQIEELPSTAPAGFWDEWAREADYGGRWHSVGEQLGIRGFGVNANEADAGRELVVPHTETEYDEQEELYVVVRGRARFTCDGETVELGPGGLLFVEHAVPREAVAVEDGTLVLCVGGTPGRPYSPS